MEKSKAFPYDEAIHKSIQVEKDAMNYYLSCASVMKDRKAADLFALLAREEREHAESFFQAYLRDDLDFETFISAPNELKQGWLAEAGKTLADLNERGAMLIALEQERRLAEQLKAQAHGMKDSAMRAIYEENARLTDRHYQLIEAEYARLMGMVHESEIDTFVRE